MIGRYSLFQCHAARFAFDPAYRAGQIVLGETPRIRAISTSTRLLLQRPSRIAFDTTGLVTPSDLATIDRDVPRFRSAALMSSTCQPGAVFIEQSREGKVFATKD